MKVTDQERKEAAQYAAWLSEQLDELGISQKELGEAVGLTPKTISRYALGENNKRPPERIRAAIAAYIKKRAVYGAFEHIPCAEFAEILKMLLKEFEMSQSELAEAVGKSQKDISKYVNMEAKADTRTQYKILNHFHTCSYAGDFYSSLHFDTAVNLEYMLWGEEEDSNLTYYLRDCGCEGKIGKRGNYRHCLCYILTLPVKLQDFIYQHFYAFYDDMYFTQTVYGGREILDFRHYAYGMDLFRQLSKEKQSVIVGMLEKQSFIGFPRDSFEENFFCRIRDYYCVISADIQGMKQSRNCFREEKSKKSFAEKFEALINYEKVDDKRFMKELQYKLTLTKYEWYVWMLFLIYDFKGLDLLSLCNEMVSMIHDF
ncbi:MAG: transcriptional regulator [Ruminococcus sp.]|nr:transcriptional regulator [Ruminococcus sp.]